MTSRSAQSENRKFNTEWTNKYLFTLIKDKIVCLVCRETVAVPKVFNIKRHFNTKHSEIAKLEPYPIQIIAGNFMKSLKAEQESLNNSKTTTQLIKKIKESNSFSYNSDTEEEKEHKEDIYAVNEMLPITTIHEMDPLSYSSLLSESNQQASPETTKNGIKRKYDYDERIEEAYNVMKAVQDTSRRDENDIYGECIASRIKNSNQNQRAIAIAKYQIDTVLFNLEMGAFNKSNIVNVPQQLFTPMCNETKND